MNLLPAHLLESIKNNNVESQNELKTFLENQNVGYLNQLRCDIAKNLPEKLQLLDCLVLTVTGKPKTEIKPLKESSFNSPAINKYIELKNKGLIDKTQKYIGVNADGSIVYAETMSQVLKLTKGNAYCSQINSEYVFMPSFI